MKAIGLFISFLMVLIIGFYAIGFSATITAPNNTTAAGQQYANLTKATDLANSGMQGFMLLLIGAMLLSAAGYFYYSFNKGRR